MNCDSIARWYRWIEYAGFGGELQRRRVAFLGKVADPRRIIVAGEGDGRFLVRLVDQNRDASIDYVDVSERMLGLARERAGTDRVTYHQADALTLQLPEAEYDLICTHFFLDCLDEQDAPRFVDRISRASTIHARWLISEFREPHTWARFIVRTLYFFFHLTTGLGTTRLVDHRPLLERAGFRLQHEEASRFGLLASELWIR